MSVIPESSAPTQTRGTTATRNPPPPRPASRPPVTSRDSSIFSAELRRPTRSNGPDLNALTGSLGGRPTRPFASTFGQPGLLQELVSAPRLSERMSNFERGMGHHGLSQRDAREVDGLTGPRSQMYRAQMDLLERQQREGMLGPQYMVNSLQNAANIAGDDPRLMVELTHGAFAATAYHTRREIANRCMAGGGHAPGLETIETAENHYLGQTPEGDRQVGFNRYIRENPRIGGEDRTNTVSHHFGEYFMIGARGGQEWERFVMGQHPDNTPDTRSAHFGGMLGAAVREGRISNQQAVDLFRYAYTTQTDYWASRENHYDIAGWMHAAGMGAPRTDLLRQGAAWADRLNNFVPDATACYAEGVRPR